MGMALGVSRRDMVMIGVLLAGLTAEDADAALQHILRPERMAVMYIEPDGTAVEEDEEEETEE